MRINQISFLLFSMFILIIHSQADYNYGCPTGERNRVSRGTTVGQIWGSSPYTTDTHIEVAAVHAGILAVGEVAIITYKHVGVVQDYYASFANGVQTRK